MKQVVRFLRKWWWLFLLGAAIAAFVAWRVLRPTDNPTVPPPEPKFLDKAREEISRIELEGEVEKARVTAQADAQNSELDRIEEMGQDDPVAAREALSAFLNSNL